MFLGAPNRPYDKAAELRVEDCVIRVVEAREGEKVKVRDGNRKS